MPIRIKPGRAARVDYEYERNGTANLFMLFAPLEGWRHAIPPSTMCTCSDLADIHFPLAKTIVLIQDLRELSPGRACTCCGLAPLPLIYLTCIWLTNGKPERGRL
jgi:hypothetical protein